MTPRNPKVADRGARWSTLLGDAGRARSVQRGRGRRGARCLRSNRAANFGDLAAQQLVTRTHGGVVASAVAYDLPVRYKQGGGDSAKDRIATFAANLVPEGTVVGFNGGTTTSADARAARGPGRPRASARAPVVTVVDQRPQHRHRDGAAAVHPLRLARRRGRPESYELTGPLASMVLGELWLDTVVLGVDGVSAAGGATCEHEGEAGINSLMVQRADRVVVVGTGDKVGRRAFARICSSEQIHVLVTDATAPPARSTSSGRQGSPWRSSERADCFSPAVPATRHTLVA